jgi:hypothetical protein
MPGSVSTPDLVKPRKPETAHWPLDPTETNSVLPTPEEIRRHTELRRRRRSRTRRARDGGNEDHESESAVPYVSDEDIDPSDVGLDVGEEQGEEQTIIEKEEVCDEPIQTRSPSKIEGVSAETNRLPFRPETFKSNIDNDFQFVDIINESLSGLKLISIPINHNLFGKMEVTNAKRYKYYTGEPEIKISSECNSTIPGFWYIVQVPPGIDTSNITQNFIRMFNHTYCSLFNGITTLPLKWMNPIPRQNVVYPTTATSPQLGNLLLVLAIPTGASFAGADTNAKITIHCNTSNLSYDIGNYSFTNFSYNNLPYTRVNIV